MASTSLTKAVQRVGSDAITKMTFSAWIKRSKLGEGQIFNAYQLSSYYTRIYFNGSDALAIYSYIGGAQEVFVKTNRLFRDTNAWYHMVVTVDTTQATASDRIKIYINGVQETSFASGAEVYPSQNSGFGQFNDTGATLYIGSSPSATNFDGSMSHINYTPYTAYDPTAFGSTDTTTGEWKINASPSVTYSTAGFFILKNGNSVTDQSGNSNNFTVAGGTLTKTEDCPDNVFATMNSLDKNTNVVLENGNNTSYSSANNTWVAANRATLGIAKDKFYWEMKITGSGTANGLFFGVCADTVALITSQGIQDNATEKAKGILLFCDDGQSQLDTNSRASMTSAPAFNDVLGCAVDRDNNTVKFYKNGSEVGSIDISSSPLATCSHIMPFMINYYTNTKFNFNFGNGYFGTTAVSSAGSNASNNGIFEYDVPTGYTALSTKGLNL